MVGHESLVVSPPTLQSTPPALSPRRHGVTKPLSLAGPSEADLLRNKDLEKFLIEAELYESKEEADKRVGVLARIKQIVIDWVKQLTRLRGYTDQMVEDANAVLYTFGSYRLGKNAMISGAITGALAFAVNSNNRDKIVMDAITGGAVATVAEFLKYLN